MAEEQPIDWSACPLVERDPLKLSGVPILKHTRLQADAVVGNYESGSEADEIADMFDIDEELVLQILAYARAQRQLVVAA